MLKSTLFLFAGILLLASCRKEPIANYEIDILNCESPYEVQFTNTSQNFKNYHWEINGVLINESSPVLSINEGRMTTVKLHIENGKKMDEKVENFQPEWFYDPPISSFQWTYPDCEAYKTVQFYENSTGLIDSYFWDFGDGKNSLSANPTHVYGSEGNYAVKFSVIRCKDTATSIINVSVVPENVYPRASFTTTEGPTNGAGSDILLGHYIKFNNQSTNASSYQWDFGNGSTSSLASPKYTYPSEGTYTVTLTSICSGNADVYTRQIKVKAPTTISVESIKLTKFPESDGSTEWDYDADEELSDTELRPDIYIKVMKGICVVYKSSTSSNQGTSSLPSWTLEKDLTNLDDTYQIELWDEDSGDDQLMDELDFTPADYMNPGVYPSSITISYGDLGFKLEVSWS
ncbi:MAG: PKD repeat protein [Crocinitomix sp.]|jgi:PKD repeat protein